MLPRPNDTPEGAQHQGYPENLGGQLKNAIAVSALLPSSANSFIFLSNPRMPGAFRYSQKKEDEMRNLSKLVVCLISFFVFAFPASAFQMQPVGTEYDRKLAQLDETKVERLLVKIVDRGAGKFLEPVHEEITQRIYECNDNWGDKTNCAKQQFAPKAVIDGARWNDNPPFMVKENFLLPNGETGWMSQDNLGRVTDCSRLYWIAWINSDPVGPRWRANLIHLSLCKP